MALNVKTVHHLCWHCTDTVGFFFFSFSTASWSEINGSELSGAEISFSHCLPSGILKNPPLLAIREATRGRK